MSAEIFAQLEYLRNVLGVKYLPQSREPQDLGPRLMFVGDFPSIEEEGSGSPFEGPAGMLLSKMIGAMGLQTENVYISHLMKSRPPSGRVPSPEELEKSCDSFKEEVRFFKPDAIIALGNVASAFLTGGHGNIVENNMKIFTTLHPRDLLINPADKKRAWGDLQKVMREFKMPSSRRR